MKYSPVNKDSLGLVWDCWERHADENPQNEAIIHWDALGETFRWTYSGLFEAALKYASFLTGQGVKSRDICALVIRHRKDFYPVYMGLSLIGAVPAVLAYPNARLHPDKFLQGISGIVRKSGLDWIVSEKEMEPVIKPHLSEEKRIRGVLFPLEPEVSNSCRGLSYGEIKRARGTVSSSDSFLLQFSSGTTGLQKGVILSHQAVLEHVRRYSEAIKMSAKDKVITWLPLYHDMGLIAAFHMPLIYGIQTIQLDPFQWVTAPVILFDAITKEKPTLTWLPNFSYNFMADRVRPQELEGIDLASMRMFINCSEVVRSASHDKFLNSFQKYGVDKRKLSACYAMAETTFAVTQAEPAAKLSELSVDRDLLLKKEIRIIKDGGPKKICVSSGKPISGCSLKILSKDGSALPEDRVGSIAIRSLSLFEGYLNNAEKTQEVMRDGWYLSRDLGFCHEGEYYVLGREDDVIVVAGNNIYPEDVEDAVNRVEGVLPGRVVAFGMDDPNTGTQKLAVAAETPCETEAGKESLELAIKRAGMAIDVTIAEVHLVPPRWLIKSSSGKLSRHANKKRILEKQSS